MNRRDEACEKWHRCRRCTWLDDPSCDPRRMYGFEQRKRMDSNNNYIPDSFEINCDSDANTTPCMKNRCECDNELARTLYVLAGFASNSETVTPIEDLHYWLLIDAGFDPTTDNQCKPEPVEPKPVESGGSNPCANGGCTGGSHTTACCGTYPNRFSYSTKTHECCSNSQVVFDVEEIGKC